MKNVFYYPMLTGLVEIIAEEDAIIGINIDSKRNNLIHMEETPIIRQAKNELQEYFDGKRKQFIVPIRFCGTHFQNKVWNRLTTIPYAQTVSYQDVAIAIGNQKACRAVGGAIHHNPIGIIVPCHRVIGKNGSLVGYAGGIHLKKQLLDIEQSNG